MFFLGFVFLFTHREVWSCVFIGQDSVFSKYGFELCLVTNMVYAGVIPILVYSLHTKLVAVTM